MEPTPRTRSDLDRRMLERIRLLERRLGRRSRDTGWVDLSAHLLGSGTLRGRIAGPNVVLQGWPNTDVPIGVGVTNISTTPLPSQWRPSINAWGAGYWAGVSTSVLIRPDGTLAISNRNAVAIVGQSQFTIAYMTG